MTVRLPVVEVPFAVEAKGAPELPLSALDTVWFQLTGTLCNIACRHCFITCGPREERVPMMSVEHVRRVLDEAEALGVRDYYFTGGEPMLHPEFWPLVDEALARGPLTVLTNGILIDDEAAGRARKSFDAARYSFDLRVSLDGMTAEENDPVRGRGTFAEITRGIAALARVGLSPALTVVEHADGMGVAEARARFLAFARSLGLTHPRVKFLPLLRIGREERRTHGYDAGALDCLTHAVDPLVADNLVCGSSRLVTAHGVMTCPILLDAPGARLGATLADSLRPIRLRWAACRTCIVDGLSCRT
ncbi:MAG TPA: radical SAM protein [Kofleriaceae bacterium]|nr:radical SAM protein [Kofleriaceae bacterium]